MTVSSFQHIGNRSNQQDAYLVDKSNCLFVVCDGVGGRNKGEIASQTIIDYITVQFNQNPSRVNAQYIKQTIQQALLHLNIKLERDPDLKGAATTIALLYISNSIAYTAHVGDSRVILFKKQENQLWSTKDHSVVQELFDAGVIKSEEEMNIHPLKNRITNAITCGKMPSSLKVSIHELRNIKSTDIFIVCSDGVLEHFTNGQIIKLLINSSAKDAFDTLKNTSLKHSKDNNTCIMIEM